MSLFGHILMSKKGYLCLILEGVVFQTWHHSLPGYYIVGISVPNSSFLNPTVPRETLCRSSCIESSLSPEFLSVYTENRTTTHSQAKYA